MNKTVEQKAFEAYEKNMERAPKYQIPDNMWMDWFKKGYNQCKEDVSASNWHNLITNPNDLPEHREMVIVRLASDTYKYAIGTYSYSDNSWYLREDDDFYHTEKKVAKWMKINE